MHSFVILLSYTHEQAEDKKDHHSEVGTAFYKDPVVRSKHYNRTFKLPYLMQRGTNEEVNREGEREKRERGFYIPIPFEHNPPSPLSISGRRARLR